MPKFDAAEPPKQWKTDQGNLYFIKKSKKNPNDVDIEMKVDKIGISNGLEWSLNDKIMYYIDSPTLKVNAFDFDSDTGTIKNRRTCFDLKSNGVKGFPDGMTICELGHLWVACFGGSQVSGKFKF